MAYCSNCGTAVQEGATFCTNCGARLQGTDSASDNTRTFAVLAVIIPVLFFLPLVAEQKTTFGTFWANQAVLLFIAFALSSTFSFIFIGFVLGAISFVLWIIAIVNVCKGEMKPIPIIGSITIIK